MTKCTGISDIGVPGSCHIGSYYLMYTSQWRIQDFPLGGGRGGAEPLGGANLQRGCFLAKTYVKTKPLDPPMHLYWKKRSFVSNVSLYGDIKYEFHCGSSLPNSISHIIAVGLSLYCFSTKSQYIYV